MKVIQALQSVDNMSAGPTHSVGYLSDLLVKHNHQVTVMALGKQPRIWPHASDLEVYGGPLSRFGMVPPAAIRAVKQHARETCIMHGHGIWRLSNLFPLLLNDNSAAKTVWSPRGMMSTWAWNFKSNLKQPFWNWLQRPSLERVNCFHATAENELEDVRRLEFKQPVAVIPNGVQMPVIRDIPKNNRRVVFLSRIHEKKGLHLLIPAWRTIQDRFPDWELHIAGKIRDDYGNKMVALAGDLGAERIFFLGEVLGDEKRQLLAGARLFVLPSFSENFGIAVAEAMAHGTPVITTNETPWTDLEQHYSGWCIHPCEKELTETLQKAMSLPLEQLDEMGEAARQWMERQYSWEVVAVMMDQFYCWLFYDGVKPDFIHE